MTILIVLGAVATMLGSLGGLGALLSAMHNRRALERSSTVSEFHEIETQRSGLLDELQEMRALDRVRFDERLSDLEERVTTAEARLDQCEEEKAVLKAERVELIRRIEEGR